MPTTNKTIATAAIWLVLITLCAACKPGISVYVIGAEKYPEAKKAVEFSVRYWNHEHGGGILEISDSPAYGDLSGIYIHVKDKVKDSKHNHAYTVSVGPFSHIGIEKNVFLDDTIDESNQAWLLTHEMGHSLGLSHHSDPDNIMHESPIRDGGFDITKRQKRRLRAISTIEALF